LIQFKFIQEEEKETKYLLLIKIKMKKKTLEQFLLSRYTGATTASYIRTIENFKSTHFNTEKFIYMDIVKYMKIVQENYDGTTPTRILCAIKSYYDYLVSIGLRHDHPCKRYSIKVDRNRDVVFDSLFSYEELQLLLNREERYNGMKERNRALMSLFIYQGLTLGEMANLKIQDIDIDLGTVRVKKSKKNGGRILCFSSEQGMIFLKYMKVRNRLLCVKSDSFLISLRGVPISGDGINALVKSFKPLFLDKNLNPQTIRQSVISNWLNINRKPLDEVQIMAGHKYPSSTEIYLRKDMSEHLRMINAFHPLK